MNSKKKKEKRFFLLFFLLFCCSLINKKIQQNKDQGKTKTKVKGINIYIRDDLGLNCRQPFGHNFNGAGLSIVSPSYIQAFDCTCTVVSLHFYFRRRCGGTEREFVRVGFCLSLYVSAKGGLPWSRILFFSLHTLVFNRETYRKRTKPCHFFSTRRW